MSVTELNDNDLMLLDSYLDDELSSLEHDALEQRLSREPALSAALNELRGQRALRCSVFATYEPAQAMVQRVVAGVERKVEGHMVWAERARGLRWLSGVAAMLLIGFLGGYISRGGPAGATPSDGANTMVATNNNGAPAVRNVGTLMPNTQVPGSPQFVSANNTPDANGTSPRGLIFPGWRVPSMQQPPNNAVRNGAPNVTMAGYDVAVTDEAGNVIGVQRFPTLQEAQEFRNDLSRLQQQRKQLQNGGVRLIGDDF